MNRTVLYIATSLDGFVAGPNDDISWLAPYSDVDYGFDAFFAGIGTIIQGRRAYDVEVEHGWETPHPVPTFVLSHRLPQRPAHRSNVIFTSDDIAEVLRHAKQASEKDVWVEGGANVAQQFILRGLVDDIVLSLAPIILGDGIPLFGHMNSNIPLTLRDVRRFDKGLVQLHYTVD